jgi:DNA polymerase-4
LTSDPPILHVDMDAFYASVELLARPELRGRPVAVGGTPEGRGVIAAASYEARAFGVHSAQPTAEALRRCPQLVLLPPDFERYAAVSRQVMAIFKRYTPLVEPLSLDEAFLDVTGCERLFGGSLEIGRRIRAEILSETGLVASVGIAPNKYLAKLASGLDKPNGFRVIRAEQVAEVLAPLSVERLFGVGERTAKRLLDAGFTTIGQIAALTPDEARERLGPSGGYLYDLARGLDNRRVVAQRVEKSHGIERTFPEDIHDRAELRKLLFAYCEEVAFDLRSRGLRGRTVTVKARFWNFRTVTRSQTLPQATDLGVRLFAVARELLERVPAGPLRLLGVSLSSLEDVRQPIQNELFPPENEAGKDERQQNLVAGLDRIRRKYGRSLVQPASLLGRPPLGRASPAGAQKDSKKRPER